MEFFDDFIAHTGSFKAVLYSVARLFNTVYKKYYVEYEYLLCSKAFEKSEYYIISAHEDNYLHLTGLHTNLDALSFFEKCYSGSLE